MNLSIICVYLRTSVVKKKLKTENSLTTIFIRLALYNRFHLRRDEKSLLQITNNKQQTIND
jgi:hypothetical protein